MKEDYGESAPSFSIIKYWTAELRRGRTSIFDKERPGRPREVLTPEMVDKVHEKILDDHRIKLREIASIYKKAFIKVGAEISLSGKQTQPLEIFRGRVWHCLTQISRNFASICNCRRNLDTSPYTRKQ